MNSMTPIIARSVRALLPLTLLLSVTAMQAQAGSPIPPKITYTVTGQGLTGSGDSTYFYQDITFTVYGFYNVSPQVVASGVDNIYGFSNSTFEAAGGIVTPASLPPGYTFNDNSDFVLHTILPSRAIFATDPLSGFNLVTDIPNSESPPLLEDQVFNLLDKNGNVIATATPQPVPETATGWSLGLLLALGGFGLCMTARRRRHLSDYSGH